MSPPGSTLHHRHFHILREDDIVKFRGPIEDMYHSSIRAIAYATISPAPAPVPAPVPVPAPAPAPAPVLIGMAKAHIGRFHRQLR